MSKHKLVKEITAEEKQKYKAFGKIDPTQNYLELFNPSLVHDLFEIMGGCSDNPLKAKYVLRLMKNYGFYDVGLGTNIFTMASPMYPGVVFKFAVDDNGVLDNLNDALISQLVNECLGRERHTRVLASHPSGIVSVQERKVPILSQERMEPYRREVLNELSVLARRFLIVDLAPDYFHLNYCINRDGTWGFIDASDLFPLEELGEVSCKRAVGYNEKKRKVIYCGGPLQYDDGYYTIRCNKCHGEIQPSELRPH